MIKFNSFIKTRTHLSMKRKNVSTIFTICLFLLLFFYILNIVTLFYLINVSHIITRTYEKFSTRPPDVFRETSIEVKTVKHVWEHPDPTCAIPCDTSTLEYDLCYLNRPTSVDPTAATISSVPDPTSSTPPLVVTIRPYPRKAQPEAMQRTKELTITASPPNTPCVVSHHTPALIYSAGGFTGNVFHDFNEGWVPLYVTIEEHFNDRNVILGIVNCSDWWLRKYSELFPLFTRHPIINLDKETIVHCFPSAIVGLKSHGMMSVDPTLQRGWSRQKTMMDFRALVTSAYEIHANHANRTLPSFSSSPRPKLALLNRGDTRKILNKEEIRNAAEDVGFEVVGFEITAETPLHEVYRLLNSSNVFVGVHGAGLTHELFLRPGSVLIQIIPVMCGWLADICYGKLAIRLGVEHITYEAGLQESSLANDEYTMRELSNPDRDPGNVVMGNLTNWHRYMNQTVKLDVVRFKRYLKRAYEKVEISMKKQGLKAKP